MTDITVTFDEIDCFDNRRVLRYRLWSYNNQGRRILEQNGICTDDQLANIIYQEWRRSRG